ncbi:SAM-dependent methyltransferase [Chitinivorax sp. B]|uniref:class I SAM-dependent methyltransferase n=1 Tax=Chitinivorax sp. B TaxID=2502235 RepID=UPI0010F487F9|nr:SAM-dependent methyltransferase [Chitinivorax sp. B]
MQQDKNDIRPGQSLELLKALHILTRDGKMNQDSRRKLKQVYHLYQFIEPLLQDVKQRHDVVRLVDHGAGKSYLGFILYDLFFKTLNDTSHIYGIETRDELVTKSRELAHHLGFPGMSFLNLSVADSITSDQLPEQIDVVTALHACNTATDDAIHFALKKQARHIVLVPCCQAEVASELRKNKAVALANPLAELWRHPIHTREFGSQATNVLRCLQLQAHGYQVTVTELVGWEHSMKNELIVAQYNKDVPRRKPAERLKMLLEELGLQSLEQRFFVD